MASNIEIVRSILAAWERGDFHSVDWADPEIEYVHADGPEPGRWRGLEEMATVFRSVIEVWREWRVAADEFRELDGDRVLVLSHYIARGKSSGLDLGGTRAAGANLFHLRDSKVTRLAQYWDREHALADLGLSE